MSKKILLVEDEKLLGEMYKAKFIQAGFEVVWAFEAKEALGLAKKEKPDLIVLDMLLPKENGVIFLTWLRKEPGIGQTPVVAFSNYDDPETKKG
ncbi:MAG: response regulator, partial [bacterium]|nr:response regulator [bacterium]